MRICQLSTENFRTFDELDLELNNLNVLIGANASGKSNFLDLIEFIGDLAEYGLEDAMYLQGGVNEVKNRSIGDSKNFKLEFKIDDVNGDNFIPSPLHSEDRIIDFELKTLEYHIEVEFDSEEFRVVDEDIEVIWDLVEYERKEDEEPEGEHMDEEMGIRVFREGGGYDYNIKFPDIERDDEDIKDEAFSFSIPKKIRDYELEEDESFFESENSILLKPVSDRLASINVYNIEPSEVKSGSQISGKKELKPDGSNLAIVLEDIGKDEEKREKFNNLAKDLLPFTDDFSVERNEDRSFHLKIKETFFPSSKDEENYANPSMISDGTVNIYSLIVALYFEENKPILGIEEPEKNVHPSLLKKIVRMMEEAADDKQIFATTHESVLLREVELSDILMIKRNDEGFSEITKPEDNEIVSTFLQENIEIEDLMRDNIMG